ncbi:MAG: hypothetical protein LKE54_04455 [Prevotella sp.]|jgi:hypothetical protein|nr:hypothetical protein [Prevotella sp.]MCH3994294.1 hypothetical protein [Prevotella sp.]
MGQKYEATKSEEQVLDSYFSTRANNSNVNGMVYFEEDKTTTEIQDDLQPILEIKDSVIVDYMLKNGYVLKTREDGSPFWMIYRMK